MIALHNAVAQSIAVSGRLSSVGYSGEHFDARAQQQYLRARFYSPTNGRFNRLDPYAGNMQDPQSLHKYAYVHGEPISGVDPTGTFLGTALIGGLGALGVNTRKSQSDTAAGGKAALATWAAVTKHTINVLTYVSLVMHAVAQMFRWNGRLSYEIAQAYTTRGSVGTTGVGLFYTHLFDDGYEFLDDGGMREHSRNARLYWMFERAMGEGLLESPHGWVQVRTSNFENTGKKVEIAENFWVGGLHSFEGHGQYSIRIVKENVDSYEIEIKQVVMHWVGTDRADARPAAEKNTNPTLYKAEKTVGWVGDGLLGADFNFAIHDQEEAFETQKRIVFKSELNKRVPFE